MPSLASLFGGGEAQGPTLGLYIAQDALFLAEAKAVSGRIEVAQLVRVPVPARAETGQTSRLGTLNTDFLSETARLVDLLKPVLEQGRWGSRRVTVSLSPQFGLARYFVMPAVDRRYWKQSVPLEAKKYVPFQFSDLSYDFQVFPGATADKTPKMGVLFALTPQKNVDAVNAIVSALGLELGGMELVSYSAPRVWLAAGAARPEDVTAQVHADAHSVYFVMHKGGVPYITRELHWTGEQFDRRRLDLPGSIDFAKKQLGVAQVQPVVTGSADLAPWAAGVKEDLNVEGASLSLKDAGLPTTEWGVVAAVGASLRGSKGLGAVSLDISQSFKKQSEDMRVVRALTIATGSVVALLLLGSIYNEIAIVSAVSKLASLRRKSIGAAALGSMKPEAMQAYVADLQKESAELQEALSRRQPVTPWWGLLADAVPAEAWIEKADFKAVMATEAGGTDLTLTGYAYGKDKNADVELAKQFLEALKQDKEFAKTFPNCLPSFEGTGGPAEKRTPFVLHCQFKTNKS